MKYHKPMLHFITAALAGAVCSNGSNATPIAECTLGSDVGSKKCQAGNIASKECKNGSANPNRCRSGASVGQGCVSGNSD
jgi:hypothetical protein